MKKISLILTAAALSVQNSGARAASNDFGAWVAQPVAAPNPALVAVLALVGMAFLVLMARTPLGAQSTSRLKWTGFLGHWPSQRTALGLLAMIAVSGSLGIA